MKSNSWEFAECQKFIFIWLTYLSTKENSAINFQGLDESWKQ